MNDIKRQKLEAAGWTEGTVADFLELSPEESAIVEFKLSLSRRIKEKRKSENISQATLAERMQSSQSRIAKIEAGDASVSMDLLVKALLYTGATQQEIAQTFMPSIYEKELQLA